MGKEAKRLWFSSMSLFYSVGANNGLVCKWRWCYLCVNICVTKWVFWFYKIQEHFFSSGANISFSKISYFFYIRIRFLLTYFMKYFPITTIGKKFVWYLNEKLSCPQRSIFSGVELRFFLDLKPQLLFHNHPSILHYINSRQGMASET
jgi:hypothetical protein